MLHACRVLSPPTQLLKTQHRGGCVQRRKESFQGLFLLEETAGAAPGAEGSSGLTGVAAAS